jgi:hypothetical protein
MIRDKQEYDAFFSLFFFSFSLRVRSVDHALPARAATLRFM